MNIWGKNFIIIVQTVFRWWYI